jgi:hypothetical protein
MTYQRFKTELFHAILRHEEGQGKRIRLLETGDTSEEIQIRAMIKQIHFMAYGCGEEVMREDFIHIGWGKGGTTNSIYWKVRDCFERFRKEGWQGVWPGILFQLRAASLKTEWVPIGRAGFEQCRNRLIVKPFLYESHPAGMEQGLSMERRLSVEEKPSMEEGICRKKGAVGIRLHSLMWESETECVTEAVGRERILRWGQPEDFLLRYALLNSYDRMPPRLSCAADEKKAYLYREGDFVPEEGSLTGRGEAEGAGRPCASGGGRLPETAACYRLSAVPGGNGALAMFYPEILEKISVFLGDDYYADFSDLHAVRLYPARHGKPKEICRYPSAARKGFFYRYCRARKDLLEV